MKNKKKLVILSVLALFLFSSNALAQETPVPVVKGSVVTRGPIKLCRECQSDNVTSTRDTIWIATGEQYPCKHGLGSRAYDFTEKEYEAWRFNCHDCGAEWWQNTGVWTGRSQLVCNGIMR